MTRRTVLLMVGSGLTLVVFTGAGFLLGNARAVQAMSVRRVEPTQLATAMAGDHFFSDYRTSTLLVRGRVDAVAGARVELASGADYRVFCTLAGGTPAPRVGDEVTIVTEGGTANRGDRAVELLGCTRP